MKKVLYSVCACALATAVVFAADPQPDSLAKQAYQPVHNSLQTFAQTISDSSKRLDETVDRINEVRTHLENVVGLENERLQVELNSLLGVAQQLETQIAQAIKGTRSAFESVRARGEQVRRWWQSFNSSEVVSRVRDHIGALMAQ